MRGTWQLQEAKNKLSELVERAKIECPQRIIGHGKEAAVLLSLKDYHRLTQGKESVAEFFRRSPLRGVTLERAKDLPRKVEL